MNKKGKLHIDVKKIKTFFSKNKIPVTIVLTGILLMGITLYISYAYYQVKIEEKIIGGQVGEIADLEVRIMAQDRDANGNAISNSYSIYPYIPKAGYQYNEAKSYCTNGATINYANYEAIITAKKNDLCYLYFDSTASLDITLNVFAENVNSDGVGTGEYTKLETVALPNLGYVFNREKSSCKNGSALSYIDAENMFSVSASGKDVCDAYMDALDVDIALKIFVQSKSGSTEYKETNKIPNNVYYTLNDKSSCTGSSTLTMNNQKVVIGATSKTSCEAYLDISTGPIIESVRLNSGTLTINPSNTGSVVTTYYYSTDGGVTYSSSSSNTISVGSATNVSVYVTDASGNKSAIVKTSDYSFNGFYPYQSTVQQVAITEAGYYLLETWGAMGGSYNETYAVGGAGGYSSGYIYLNAGDNLFVHTGGKGSASTSKDTPSGGGVNGGGNASYRGGTGGGATDIRINQDNLYARVIVAGGGGGAYAYDDTYKANGGAGGGSLGVGGGYYAKDYLSFAGHGANIYAGGAGGTGSSAEFNGQAGTFGVGGDTGSKYADDNYYSSGAGGGGFYGGGAGGNYNGAEHNRGAGGGGGSGYVYSVSTASSYPSGCLLTSAYYMTSALMRDGSSTFLNPYGVSEAGHNSDGYAKITYIGKTL